MSRRSGRDDRVPASQRLRGSQVRRERPTKHGPDIVPNFPRQSGASASPATPTLPFAKFRFARALVAIVQAQIAVMTDPRADMAVGQNDLRVIRIARAQATVFLRDGFDTVRSILAEPVGDAFEVRAASRCAVEPDESGNSAHQRAPPNRARGVNRPISVSNTAPRSPTSTQAWAMSA